MGLAQPYRVAIRTEGEFINAYWARSDSMEGAIKVASILKELCDDKPELFDMFRLTAEGIARYLVKRVTGRFADSVVMKDPATGKPVAES